MKRKKKLHLVLLGCPKAQVEAEVGVGNLLSEGYALTLDPEDADLVVIQTCSFIEPAIREAEEWIEQMGGYKKEGKIRTLFVAGCLVDRMGETNLKNRFPFVDRFYPSSAFRHWGKTSFPKPFGPALPSSSDLRLLFHKTYTYMKIAEGCDRKCAYCTIPSFRGPQRSRPLDDLLKEARIAYEIGVKELILVSQDTIRWGRDLSPPSTLSKLLSHLLSSPHPPWIRLHYLYPEPSLKEIVPFLSLQGGVLPYLDIPIQHISNPVLSRMRRGYREKDLRELLEWLHKKVPDLILRTTILVGHPGEGEKELKELKEFLKEGWFHWVGIFPYYPEEGTPSAQSGELLPREEIERRKEEIEEIVEEISSKTLLSFVGKEVELLVEGRDPESGEWYGRFYGSSPEVDGVVFLRGYRGPGKTFKKVVLEDFSFPDFYGKPLGTVQLQTLPFSK
jgi:ribosomal protein S12 methylthiotransferase